MRIYYLTLDYIESIIEVLIKDQKLNRTKDIPLSIESLLSKLNSLNINKSSMFPKNIIKEIFSLCLEKLEEVIYFDLQAIASFGSDNGKEIKFDKNRNMSNIAILNKSDKITLEKAKRNKHIEYQFFLNIRSFIESRHRDILSDYSYKNFGYVQSSVFNNFEAPSDSNYIRSEFVNILISNLKIKASKNGSPIDLLFIPRSIYDKENDLSNFVRANFIKKGKKDRIFFISSVYRQNISRDIHWFVIDVCHRTNTIFILEPGNIPTTTFDYIKNEIFKHRKDFNYITIKGNDKFGSLQADFSSCHVFAFDIVKYLNKYSHDDIIKKPNLYFPSFGSSEQTTSWENMPLEFHLNSQKKFNFDNNTPLHKEIENYYQNKQNNHPQFRNKYFIETHHFITKVDDTRKKNNKQLKNSITI